MESAGAEKPEIEEVKSLSVTETPAKEEAKVVDLEKGSPPSDEPTDSQKDEFALSSDLAIVDFVRRFHSGQGTTELKKRNESRRFLAMSTLTLTVMVAEVAVGLLANSLTLLSDALHMLSDFVALMVGYIAHTYAIEADRSVENPITYLRVEVVGALINGVALLAFCVTMATQALERMFFEREHIKDVNLVLIVGAIGLLVNILGLFIFGHSHGHGPDTGVSGADLDQLSAVQMESLSPIEKDKTAANGLEDIPENVEAEENDDDDAVIEIDDDEEHGEHGHDHSREHGHHSHGHSHGHPHDDMNIRAVFYHVMADALGSVAVMVSALIVKFMDGGWTLFVDPICTLFVVAIISYTTFPLVREAVNILLDRKPEHLDLEAVRSEVLAIDGALNVHEFHVWEIKPGRVMATCHLITDSQNPATLDQCKEIFHRFGIHNSVVQREVSTTMTWKHSSDPCFDPICAQPKCAPTHSI